jgi:hypothetical protein
VSEDAVIVEIILRTPQKAKLGAVNIVHPAAFHATNMLVRGQATVESSLFAAELQLLYYARPGQQIEVPIHGPEADFWQPLTDKFVQTHRGGVRGEFLEFLQNHLTLSRMALRNTAVHGGNSYD